MLQIWKPLLKRFGDDLFFPCRGVSQEGDLEEHIGPEPGVVTQALLYNIGDIWRHTFQFFLMDKTSP